MIYWFTGQPGSGKSTLAVALGAALRARGQAVVHLDGDELREITGNKDYSEAGRIKNITAAQRLTAKLAHEGICVVASFVSPYRWIREEFKKQENVTEIYVHTDTSSGKDGFRVQAYEPPLADFVDIDTTKASVEECLDQILCATMVPR